MSKKPKPEPDDPSQTARFLNTAKELGVDETGDGFERAFKKIVTSRPEPLVSEDHRADPESPIS